MSARKSAAQVNSAKQKKIAIGGAVLLVGILVIQGPKMLKLVSGGSSSSPPAAAAAVAPPVTPGAVPGAPAPTPVSASAAAQTSGTKFVSFETFTTKDPFAAQVSSSTASTAKVKAVNPASVVNSGAPSTGSAATSPATGTSTGSSTGTSSSAGSTTKPSFKVAGGANSTATATLAVNSKRQVVTVSHDFPEADPVFTLVSVGSNSASIAIAGGSLKTGGKTFALTVGTPTTLLNTATGKKYKLELISTAPSGA